MKILLEFIDANQGQMCLMELEEDNPHKGEKWICYKHPDGQYVTLRPATKDDLDKLFYEQQEVGRPQSADWDGP